MDASEHSFEANLQKNALDLHPESISTLQVNITKLCNQACVHCHVDASPRRKESMSEEVLEQCLTVLRKHEQIRCLDITGGAPELHPQFTYLVESAVKLGKQVMVRHNLTVSMDLHPKTGEAMSYLPEFFAKNRVTIVSSLPYYQEFFTDKQRGQGVFKKSIESLKLLNTQGYGIESSGLELNLVYNPIGAYLAPDQSSMERDYKAHLAKHFDISFNHLFVMNNIPIHRFKAQLKQQKLLESYMEKLHTAFNASAAKGVMCRSLLSVSYDGYLYDCDFNQMLNLHPHSHINHISEFNYADLLQRGINFKEHCFGCTAGAGSSCGGATA